MRFKLSQPLLLNKAPGVYHRCRCNWYKDVSTPPSSANRCCEIFVLPSFSIAFVASSSPTPPSSHKQRFSLTRGPHHVIVWAASRRKNKIYDRRKDLFGSAAALHADMEAEGNHNQASFSINSCSYIYIYKPATDRFPLLSPCAAFAIFIRRHPFKCGLLYILERRRHRARHRRDALSSSFAQLFARVSAYINQQIIIRFA